MSEKLPPVNPRHLRLVHDRERDNSLLGTIEPIGLPAGQVVTERTQLAEIVEAPALSACELLYDLNIQTTSACANAEKTNIFGEAYVLIDWQSLSPRNQEIADQIGERVEEPINTRGGVVERVKLKLKTSPKDTIEQVSKALLDLARNFEPQPLNWGFQTIEQVRKEAKVEQFELADGLLIQEKIDHEGCVYDAESKRLFYSDELRQKYVASLGTSD